MKKQIRKIIFLIAMLLSGSIAISQTITGIVSDADGPIKNAPFTPEVTNASGRSYPNSTIINSGISVTF